MKEIEVKILEIDIGDIIKRLKSIGAKKEGESTIDASHYDFEDKRLQKNRLTLRLRKWGDKIEFTSKKKLHADNDKIREELQVEVSDFDKMNELLKGIGFKEKVDIKKKRISYVLEDIRFEIDTYEGIPPLLEIEAPSEKKLQNAVEKLGFSMKDTKPWSGARVWKYYGKVPK